MNAEMENIRRARRRRIAEEIKDALRAQGLSRKEFALKMHRLPSDVTKWLGGDHNFTSDLLAEISETLGTEISGSERAGSHPGSMVTGYGPVKSPDRQVAEPATSGGIYVELSGDLSERLLRKSKEAGMSAREYAGSVLAAALRERKPSAADFYGVLPEDFPDADSLRSMRTANSFPEI